MSTATSIPVLVKQLSLALDQYERAQLRDLGITLPQGMILHYLFDHRETVCAAQLHKQFGCSKSTVSATLQVLQQKGFVTTEASTRDERMKIIRLTDKAFAVQRRMQEELRSVGTRLCRSVPRERLELLEHDLQSMLANIQQEKRGIRHA